jgi:hypothetical protein
MDNLFRWMLWQACLDAFETDRIYLAWKALEQVEEGLWNYADVAGAKVPYLKTSTGLFGISAYEQS